MNHHHRFWITAGTSGLGAALVDQLLQRQAGVAASGRDSPEFKAMARRHDHRLLALSGTPDQQAARLKEQWSSLDTLMINAGTCDYLPDDIADSQILQALITSNVQAFEHYLEAAMPLLLEAPRPHVVVILNLYTASKLSEPCFPASPSSSLPERLRERRGALQKAGIDLTVVTPHSLNAPWDTQHVPEHWTAQTAAAEILSRVAERREEVVLEALGLRTLWPLKSM